MGMGQLDGERGKSAVTAVNRGYSHCYSPCVASPAIKLTGEAQGSADQSWRSPSLRVVMFCTCSFLFFPSYFFQGPSTDIFETLPHDVALVEKEVLALRYVSFLKVPLTKMKGENPQISPNFASNRNILGAITRNVKRK